MGEQADRLDDARAVALRAVRTGVRHLEERIGLQEYIEASRQRTDIVQTTLV